MKESTHLFGRYQSLVGILTDPSPNLSPQQRSNEPAVILLNSGILHHVGPNRLYVRIARNLAEAGMTSFRFDYSGIGDSEIRKDNIPVEQWVISETQEAMTFLQERKGITQFILAGICSGADIAFLTAREDRRVCGTVLIDIYAKSSLAYTLYAYRSQLMQMRSWLKLLSGRSDFWSSVKHAISKDKIRRKSTGSGEEGRLSEKTLVSHAELLVRKGVHLMFIYSGGSPAYYNYRKYFKQGLSAVEPMENVETRIIEEADHGFTLLEYQELLIELIHNWSLKVSQKFREEKSVAASG